MNISLHFFGKEDRRFFAGFLSPSLSVLLLHEVGEALTALVSACHPL
tara:strand:- start:965 stop:1105 length:141 start_codon:yes stop_codon:yes gene_type:complete